MLRCLAAQVHRIKLLLGIDDKQPVNMAPKDLASLAAAAGRQPEVRLEIFHSNFAAQGLPFPLYTVVGEKPRWRLTVGLSEPPRPPTLLTPLPIPFTRTTMRSTHLPILPLNLDPPAPVVVVQATLGS